MDQGRYIPSGTDGLPSFTPTSERCSKSFSGGAPAIFIHLNNDVDPDEIEEIEKVI